MGAQRLTYEQVNGLQYALKYNYDVTNCTEWDRAQESLKEHHPELLAAVQALKIAELTLAAIVQNLEAPYEE
jgi:hypothetical protein